MHSVVYRRAGVRDEDAASASRRTSSVAEAVLRWGRRTADWMRGDPRRTTSVAMGVVVVWAVVSGWWMPRGPLTTGQAVVSIGVSVIVGVAIGWLVRRWWPIVAGPVLFGVLFELMRTGLTGPTVDRPELSAYGLLALVVGRGFHWLVAAVPLAWGVAVGVAVLAHRVRSPVGSRRPLVQRVLAGLRTAGTAVVGVALVALAVGLARPASTAVIEGPNGRPLAGSVAELTTVRVNDRQQPLMIRGHDTANPVLLFLAGGPGGSELGAMRRHLPDLERHFTVVTWDQRGTGKAYPDLDPTNTVTLDSYIADTIGVTDHLRARFDQDRIYLVGQSWGSTLGVLAAQRAPDRYHAFIGVGQMVSQLATDRIFYEDTLHWAQETGRGGLAADLIAIGPPPYDAMLDYELALSYEHEVYPYDHSLNHEGEAGFSENFFVSEYSLIEQVHLLAGFMDTFSVVYPQLQEIDFRRTATELAIPVFFVQGAHEAGGRAEPFAEWYGALEAPVKDVTHLDTSGHRAMFEQPEEFVAYLLDTVLPRTKR